MKKNKVNIELDLEDLFGLKEPNKNSLEYDLNFIVNNGMDEYLKLIEDEKRRDREFVELFKRNYNDIVKINLKYKVKYIKNTTPSVFPTGYIIISKKNSFTTFN